VEDAAEKYPVDTITNGTVRRTFDFGVLRRALPGWERLVHISDRLAIMWKYRSAAGWLSQVQDVKVSVWKSTRSRRISLVDQAGG